jgi:hypothetical protein
MNRDVLLEMLPDFFAKLKQVKEIARVEGKQFDKLDFDVDDLLNQFFIRTATWSLSEWEKQYRLPVLTNEPDIEYRRRRIVMAKRSNKADLIEILRAIDPTINMAWGGNILPFTIDSTEDFYDFSQLIDVLEREKPSHLSYSFTIKPNGYTVRARHSGRHLVNLGLISGSAKAGRYPYLSTQGSSTHRNIGISGNEVTGLAELQKTAGLVSGAKDVQTSFGSVEREIIDIRRETATGTAIPEQSGVKGAGQIIHRSVGVSGLDSLQIDSAINTGTSEMRFASANATTRLHGQGLGVNAERTHGSSVVIFCGSKASGEEVA